jgi:hypothetical protein
MCDPYGVRIELLDYVTEYQYALVTNAPGPFRIKMPAEFDRKKIRLDNIIEIWRGHGPGTLKLDYCGFLRGWRFYDEAGVDCTDLYGLSTMELLNRRIVYANAGTVQASMTDYADDMIKEVVRDQLGSDAAAGRNLTSVGGGFTIQNDVSGGATIVANFAYRNVLEVCQELAAASLQSSSATAVFFDIVPVVSSAVTGALAFELRTWTAQRGDDRSWDSSYPLYIGADWGNLEEGSIDFDTSNEYNWCLALGDGEGVDRQTAPAQYTNRVDASIWNLREGTQDGRGFVTSAYTSLSYCASLFLQDHRLKYNFGGQLIETPYFRYGRDWRFGDRITVVYRDIQTDALIDKVLISSDYSGQETITAKINVEINA